MQRVSSDMMNNDMQFWLRRTEGNLSSQESRMATQNRIQNLRDDPLGAARAVRYDSVVSRLQRFDKNAGMAADGYKVAENYVRQAQDIVQRLREIAVQGANGVYTPEDQKYMAQEVDELTAELVSIANARGPDGAFLFSGGKAGTEPFRSVMGAAPGAGHEVLTAVQYLGDRGGPAAQVAEDSEIPLSQPGSDIFWAENQIAVSDFDARDWRATRDSSITVDGTRIDIKAGDTVYALAAKINDSGAAVKASIDPRSFALTLQTTLPHQLRIEELPASVTGGSPAPAGSLGPLQELGILARTGLAPDNFAPSARVSGGSLFDVAMRLRDSLNRGDIIDTGGIALAGLDAGLGNLNRRVAELGSRSERLATVQARLAREIPDTTALLAREKDLDLTQAITDYKMLEYAHKAALGFAGRSLPQTLLDFLR
jgi:flagellar hook-associated protein 3 FlgL